MFRVKNYSCPKCKTIHNDSQEGYYVDGIKYPIFSNERRGYTLDGTYFDWDETHRCQKCKTVYQFENGAY